MSDERVPTLEELDDLRDRLFGNDRDCRGEALVMLRRLRPLVARADAEARILAAGARFNYDPIRPSGEGLFVWIRDALGGKYFPTAPEAAAWAEEQAEELAAATVGKVTAGSRLVTGAAPNHNRS